MFESKRVPSPHPQGGRRRSNASVVVLALMLLGASTAGSMLLVACSTESATHACSLQRLASQVTFHATTAIEEASAAAAELATIEASEELTKLQATIETADTTIDALQATLQIKTKELEAREEGFEAMKDAEIEAIKWKHMQQYQDVPIWYELDSPKW